MRKFPQFTLARSFSKGLLTVLLGTAAISAANAADYVYVGTNNPSPNQNAVLGYRVQPNGTLSPLHDSPFYTQGTGFLDKSFKLGPFDNDQELNTSPDQSTLFAVNSGSNTIAGFSVGEDGKLRMLPFWPAPSRGDTPVSIGVSPNGLTIINNAANPDRPNELGQPDIASIGLAFGRVPFELPGQSLDLPQGSFPTQALTLPQDPFVYSTTFPTTGTLNVYLRSQDGHLRLVQTITPPVVSGTQAAPLGLWSDPQSAYVYVGLVNVNKLGIYRKDHGKLVYVGTADNSGQALCWIRGTRDGRFLLTANTADNSLSVYDLSDPAAPREIQHVVAGGQGGLEQFTLSHDERHVYALQAENSAAAAGHSNRIMVFSFDPQTGALATQPDASIQLPLDGSVRPAGIIVAHRPERGENGIYGLLPWYEPQATQPNFLGL